MNYKPRFKNGTFKSMKQFRLEMNFLRTMTISLLSLALITGFIKYPYTFVFESVYAQETPIMDVTMLNTFEEQPVDRAIRDIPHETEETERRIAYMYAQAEKAGIDGDMLAHTAYCESMFYNIQSGVIEDGIQEKSYGLFQISVVHNDVTVAQAFDPYFSIDWAIAHWNTTTWYGYDRDTDTCTNTIAEYWL